MSDNGNTFLGLLAGTAIGAVLGILFAPDKGINTRQRITDEALLAKQKFAETATEIKEKAVATATTQKQTLDEHIDSIVSSASYKADDIITALESKLKDLKEKNKKLQKTL
jgi:gas vesicle protein